MLGGPGIKPRHVQGAAQVIDLPPTLLALVDVPPSARMRGTDLGPWLAGEAASRLQPAFSEMERKKVVVHRGHKLLCDTARGFCELYDLQRDPLERAPTRIVQVAGRWSDVHMDERYTQALEPADIDPYSPVSHILRLNLKQSD